MHCRTALIVACAASAVCAVAASAQTPLSRSEAVQTALDRGARLGVARADTSVANAALIAARVLPNPAVSASYSGANPNYHFSVDVPIAFPRLRQMQIRSAQLGLQAAELRFQVARATIALDADTTYTHA